MIGPALADVAASVRNYEIWSTLGWADIKFRYRRTMIGPFWIALSTGTMVLAVGIVYAGLFRKDPSAYIPYFAIGLVLWNFFSATFLEGCTVFTTAAGMIKASTVALPIHILRMTWKNVIIFLHNVVVIAALWLYFRWPLSFDAILAGFGFGLILLFLFGSVLTFSVLCTRFRDIPQIVSAVLQLIFFLTPIIWLPSDLGETASKVVIFNPLFSLIETARAPLLGHAVAMRDWLVAAACAVTSCTSGLVLYGYFRHRISYWL